MSAATALQIHCICADWCDTCTSFRTIFEQLAGSTAGHQFSWHILEDLEEKFDEIEVETFPTLLVTDAAGNVRFIGPILPNAKAMRQIIDATAAGATLAHPDLAAAWQPVGRSLATWQTGN